MLAFADKFLLGKPVDRVFNVFPPELLKPAATSAPTEGAGNE